MPIQIRTISLLTIAIVAAFVSVRSVLVPASFGRYGHYRGDSVAEIAASPIRYGGEEACLECHAGIDEVKTRSSHASVHCEVCHGPLARHAAYPPENPVAPLTDSTATCLRCHASNPTKPPEFKQVDPHEHRPGIECVKCHDPHVPEDNEP